MLYLYEVELLDEDIDNQELPVTRPAIELDEYSFIPWALERWHDRAFQH